MAPFTQESLRRMKLYEFNFLNFFFFFWLEDYTKKISSAIKKAFSMLQRLHLASVTGSLLDYRSDQSQYYESLFFLCLPKHAHETIS